MKGIVQFSLESLSDGRGAEDEDLHSENAARCTRSSREGSDHARRPPGTRSPSLAAKGQMPGRIALVQELEELLGDDLVGRAQALEHSEVLEDGLLQQPEAGALGQIGEHGHQPAPPGRLRRQDVAGAHRGAEEGLGHDPGGYRRPVQSSAEIRTSLRSDERSSSTAESNTTCR